MACKKQGGDTRFWAGRFLRLTGVCGLIGLCLGLLPDARAELGESKGAKTKQPIFTSYYRDATVFRDSNRNRIFDAGELNTTTATDGSFHPPKGKGRLYLFGGSRIETGEPNKLLLGAPIQAKSISTLTALWQALVDKKQREGKVKKLLGLPPSYKVLDFSAVPVTTPKLKAKKIRLIKADAQQDTLVQFLKALFLGATAPHLQFLAAETQGDTAPIDAVSEGLIALQSKKVVNLAELDTNMKTLAVAASKADLHLQPDQLANLAGGATTLNAAIARRPTDLPAIILGRLCFLNSLEAGSFDFSVCFHYLPAPELTSIPDKLSANPTPALSGTTVPNIVAVRVYRDGKPVATVPVVAGTWSYTSPALADGTYLFAVVALDSDGNFGIFSPAVLVTIQGGGVAPAPPAPPNAIWDSAVWDNASWAP